MHRIINRRGTGKTRSLMELAKATNGIILCSNPSAMEEKAYAYGITGLNFFPYHALIHGGLPPDNSSPIYIDDLEKCLYYISLYSIDGYTLTNED